MKYETVIGLEIHAELKTKSKIFCGCSTKFGSEQNTNICPGCLGLPGTLPVLNEKVVELATRAGLALNCQIVYVNKFDRKHYYYPDLSKNYQISQLDLPIAVNGYLDIEAGGQTKRIRINRIHIEEDAGKLVHAGGPYDSYALVDYNRAGMPLIEIVSEPDISSPEETRAYLEKIKAILQYTDVSDCKMEEGSLRCDANISLRPVGQQELGTKAELKNMNSYKSVQRGLEYEIARQAEILDAGGRVLQETRSFDDAKGITFSMRSKEQAHDYRYFPDPDLVPVALDEEWVENIRAALPELPDERKKRFMTEHALSEYDAAVLTASKDMADYYDAVIIAGAPPKQAANWLMGDVSKNLNSAGISVLNSPVNAADLAGMIKLIETGTISGKIAKTVFEEMWQTGKDAPTVVAEQGLSQISDESAIIAVVQDVINKNPQSVADFQNGKEKAIGFLVGQVMRLTKGQANPDMVNRMLRERL